MQIVCLRYRSFRRKRLLWISLSSYFHYPGLPRNRWLKDWIVSSEIIHRVLINPGWDLHVWVIYNSSLESCDEWWYLRKNSALFSFHLIVSILLWYIMTFLDDVIYQAFRMRPYIVRGIVPCFMCFVIRFKWLLDVQCLFGLLIFLLFWCVDVNRLIPFLVLGRFILLNLDLLGWNI